MIFDSPINAAVAGLLTIAVIVLYRRIERPTWVLLSIGAIALAVAAGAPHVRWTRPADVLVMIDQSASTRTAAFHDDRQLDFRLAQLLPNATVRKTYFSDASALLTQWNPPDAEAVVLFSDGQFELPGKLPPTWPVIDPNLEHARDAAVQSIHRSNDDSATAFIRNSGEPRRAICGPSEWPILPGGRVISMSSDSTSDGLHLNAGDAWPENDALPLPPPDRPTLERWWAGNATPAGWRHVSLPSDLESFTSAAVIALDGSALLSPTQQAAMQNYVTQLGGGLILIHSPAAIDSLLDDLSPLSFDAPTPARRWVILIDSSGSMSQRDGTQTRFAAACSAASAMIQSLPRNDAIAIGSFARDLHWWLSNATVLTARHAAFPPADIEPSGPTNLELLLEVVLDHQDVDLATTLIVITDGDAPIANPDSLQSAFSRQHASLNVLSIDSPNQPLATIAAATGGRVLDSTNLGELIENAHAVARSSKPTAGNPTSVTFANELQLPRRDGVLSTPTWLRQNANPLATTEEHPAAAEWTRGGGRVISLSFSPTEVELNAIAQRIARQPADPRIQFRFESQRVSIDAAQLPNCNQRNFSLSLDGGPSIRFDQTAPGRYAAAIGTSDKSRFATVKLDDTVIRRTLIPAHYAPEFDAIGINLPHLKLIATRSGGGVIQSDDVRPIQLPRVRKDLPLAAPLASLGAGCWLLAALRRKL